jgi:hypothetical protein
LGSIPDPEQSRDGHQIDRHSPPPLIIEAIAAAPPLKGRAFNAHVSAASLFFVLLQPFTRLDRNRLMEGNIK